MYVCMFFADILRLKSTDRVKTITIHYSSPANSTLLRPEIVWAQYLTNAHDLSSFHIDCKYILRHCAGDLLMMKSP